MTGPVKIHDETTTVCRQQMHSLPPLDWTLRQRDQWPAKQAAVMHGSRPVILLFTAIRHSGRNSYLAAQQAEAVQVRHYLSGITISFS